MRPRRIWPRLPRVVFPVHKRTDIPHQPALILFDCDGTLTDSHGLIVRAMQQAFAEVGLPEPAAQAVNRVIGLSLHKAVDALIDANQAGDQAGDQTGDQTLVEHIEQAYRAHYARADQDVCLFPDVRETLKTLQQRGYWLGIVTGKSKPGLLRVLQSFALQELFYVWRTADCTHSKPHPAMVLECMQEMGVTAAQTTVVGDAVFDMQMAKAANVTAYGVSFGVACGDELLRAGAKASVDHFHDLLMYYPALPDVSG